MEKQKIQWHPGIVASLEIELEQDMSNLSIEREHQLSKKPLSMDILIIKKRKNVKIQKNIGQIFKMHNVIEYKSPQDYLSINDFYKVYGYACIYQSDTEKVEQIKPEEITITFISTGFPRKMIEHLKKVRGITAVKKEAGIYYLQGDAFAMQLIVIKHLSKKTNLWLNSIRDDLKGKEEVIPLIDDYVKHKNSKLYQAAMDVIVRANRKQMQEVEHMCDALMELMEEKYKDRMEEELRIRSEQLQEELQEQIREKLQEQLKEQLQEQLKEQLQEQEKYNKLIATLLESSRIDDLKRMTADQKFRDELYKEFHIE